ncbi:MAG: cyclic nucleotide-binding domain-containing protein [Candidatus Hydrogenedentes bacterium]|nr:cyclic nucleotide-binding domain-containing protein [Candidatus Hydrogenedentota bacterium]
MTDDDKYKRYAEKVRIFKGLSPDDVDYILHHGKILHYHSGMTIFHEGTLGSNLFIVLKGEVGIFHQNDLIAKCVVGDGFGEMSVLNHLPRCASAAALSDCRLFTLDEKEINTLLSKHVAVRLLLNIIHVLSERLEGANAKNTELRRQLKAMGAGTPDEAGALV